MRAESSATSSAKSKRMQARVKEQAMQALLDVQPGRRAEGAGRPWNRADGRGWPSGLEEPRHGAEGGNMPVDASWFAAQAERRVKLGLVLADLVRRHGILQAKPEQVQGDGRGLRAELRAAGGSGALVLTVSRSDPPEVEALASRTTSSSWMLANAKVTDKAVTF
jgi:trigger factor